MNHSCLHCPEYWSSVGKWATITHLASIEVSSRLDVGHVGRPWNVLFVAQNVNSILAGHGGPVGHISRAITVVLAVNLGLRWALNGETCNIETNMNTRS